MDLLTQGVLGSVLAQSGADKNETRLAAGIGFVAGLLADADVLIRSNSDPLLSIEFHRHFTHSIFFIPIGALIAAGLMWPFLRQRISFKHVYLFSLLGFSLSGFIDACTSYGTYLFWPLYNERIAFHIISIVDPVFTLGLIAASVIAYRHRSNRIARAGLVFASLYLLVGLSQMYRAESVAMDLARTRNHEPINLIAKPTIGNLVLWRSIYEHDGRIFVDAIRVGASKTITEGGSVKRFNTKVDMPMLGSNTVLYQDIERFIKISNGYIGLSPKDPNLLGDLRYAIVPTDLEPLWGIEVDLLKQDQHALFGAHRNMDDDKKQRFWRLLSGSGSDK